MKNPYRTPVNNWPDEVIEARKAMPVNAQGHVVQPRFLEGLGAQREATGRWREWARRFPKHLHPFWLENWFAEAKARGLNP
jgi:hypothetical protein